ncbi:MAG TPA: Mov34/MPN/PAD-1 family protein [Kofleriaceae bacterium]
MTPIAIPRDVLAAIYAHAIAAFPDECCGYLVGAAPGAVDAAVACRNAQADGEHPIAPARGADTGFVIAGAELLGFARSFDTERPARIVYHSHTNGRAYFSDVDRRMAATAAGPAYPVQHVVIGVAAGITGVGGSAITEAAQFAWSDAARDYVEIARWTAGARS